MSRIMHFEIHATDPAQLITYYTALFGWSFRKWDGPAEYWLIETGPADQAGINGGLVRRPVAVDGSQALNAFVCTIGVESAATSLANAVELGGVVALPLMPVPGVGWLCYARDPDGNVFGMMQSDPSVTMPESPA